MEKKKKQETVGKILKEECKNKDVGFNELYQRVFDLEYKKTFKNTITKKQLKNWMRDKDFPNLDSIYILSEVLDINPNDLLEAKNKTQDGMRKKTSPALRRLIGKALDLARPTVNFILLLIGITLAILVAMHLGKGWKNKGTEELTTFFLVWDKDVVPYLNPKSNIENEENTIVQNLLNETDN